MRTTNAIAALVSGVAALGLTSAPAAEAAAWNDTSSKGGPVRECYLESCTAGIGTFDGERIEWSHHATNPHGNRWYYVRDSIGHTGWMYCGNLTAGC